MRGAIQYISHLQSVLGIPPTPKTSKSSTPPSTDEGCSSLDPLSDSSSSSPPSTTYQLNTKQRQMQSNSSSPDIQHPCHLEGDAACKALIDSSDYNQSSRHADDNEQFQRDLLASCFPNKNDSPVHTPTQDKHRMHRQRQGFLARDFRSSEPSATTGTSFRECRYDRSSNEKQSPLRHKFKLSSSCRYSKRATPVEVTHYNNQSSCLNSAAAGTGALRTSIAGTGTNYYGTVNYQQIPQSDLHKFFKQSCFNS